MRPARSRTAESAVVPLASYGGGWFDLSPLTESIGPDTLSAAVRSEIRAAIEAEQLPEVNEPRQYAPPLAQVGKIVCVGLNYSDHAAETGAPPPADPVVFMKAQDTMVGPPDDVLIPRQSVKTDYEVDDVSKREFQIERGGQWDKGKNCETFNPLGPWIVTADEVSDPQNLGLRLWVNGELRQDSSTREMIFGVDYLVWYLSQFMTLYPGDITNTGTPAGVAMGRPGGHYLRPGDIVELEIVGLGRQRQTLREA